MDHIHEALDQFEMDTSHSAIVPLVAAGLAMTIILYNLYSALNGPLSHVPGPWYTKFTALVYQYHSFRGEKAFWIKSLHDQYGPMVRVAPDEVTVGDIAAMKEIYKNGSGFLKSEFYEKLVDSSEPTMIDTRDPHNHDMWRKLLAGSMSESAMKTLEPVVVAKTDLLMSAAKKQHATKGFFDVDMWLHFFSTDVIGELAFGESFRMLEGDGKPNQYMQDIANTTRLGIARNALLTIFPLSPKTVFNWPLWPMTESRKLNKRAMDYAVKCLDNYEQYMETTPDPRPMLFNKIMGEKGKQLNLTQDGIANQARAMYVAGTDTVAVTGTYVMYCLAKFPAVRETLKKAIAHLPENPTNEQLRIIPYLEYVIEESLRMYGAAPSALPRSVPKGGRTLAGYYIPEGLTASNVSWTLHMDANIYPEPEKFIPERWENPTKDMKEAFSPFGGGSRICIGMHVARMQMRHVIVAFLREFPDMEPAYGMEGFTDDDMSLVEFFSIKPKGGRCLIK